MKQEGGEGLTMPGGARHSHVLTPRPPTSMRFPYAALFRSIMSEDREIAAMTVIAGALDGLESEATGRVLDWAAKRFGVEISSHVEEAASGRLEDGLPPAPHRFAEFVDLFDAVGPKTDAERALTGAYWFAVRGETDFPSQAINE